MAKSLTGSCLCGTVRYAIAADLRRFYFCHCEQCRKVSGSAFAANILAAPARIEWRRGAAHVRRFDHPHGRAFTKVFCDICGAGLPFVNVAGDTLFIPAGSLDDPAPIAPDRHIFWAERAPWFDASVTVPCCDGFADD